MTRQRRVILDEVRKDRAHPSAAEVFARVRRRLPRISLATVYRNLDLLAERGAIRRLDLTGTARRYDGETGEHYHVRCVVCGAVGDVHLAGGAAARALRGRTEYEILGHRLAFVGLCPRCRARRGGRSRR